MRRIDIIQGHKMSGLSDLTFYVCGGKNATEMDIPSEGDLLL